MPTATGASRISAVPTSNQWTVTTEPNQKQFPDLSILVSSAKSWATENMISLFKLCSDKDKVVLACSHGNEYRPSNHGRKARDDIKTDCKFRLNAHKQSDGSWNLNLTNLTHNHAPPSSLSGIANALILKNNVEVFFIAFMGLFVDTPWTIK